MRPPIAWTGARRDALRQRTDDLSESLQQQTATAGVRLFREIADEIDLLIGERTDLLPINDDSSD